MKAKLIETENVFKPIVLELTFENEKEYQFFKQLIGSTSRDERLRLTRSLPDQQYFNYNLKETDDPFDSIYNVLP